MCQPLNGSPQVSGELKIDQPPRFGFRGFDPRSGSAERGSLAAAFDAAAGGVKNSASFEHRCPCCLVWLKTRGGFLVYLVVQSSTRAIYFPQKDTYGFESQISAFVWFCFMFAHRWFRLEMSRMDNILSGWMNPFERLKKTTPSNLFNIDFCSSYVQKMQTTSLSFSGFPLVVAPHFFLKANHMFSSLPVSPPCVFCTSSLVCPFSLPFAGSAQVEQLEHRGYKVQILWHWPQDHARRGRSSEPLSDCPKRSERSASVWGGAGHPPPQKKKEAVGEGSPNCIFGDARLFRSLD